MSNLTNNTAELRDILAAVNALPEAGSGGITPTGTKQITQNGEHDVTGYAKVDVNVPDVPAVVQPLEVTENGTYTAPAGVDGYSPVTVNVPSEDLTAEIEAQAALIEEQAGQIEELLTVLDSKAAGSGTPELCTVSVSFPYLAIAQTYRSTVARISYLDAAGLFSTKVYGGSSTDPGIETVNITVLQNTFIVIEYNYHSDAVITGGVRSCVDSLVEGAPRYFFAESDGTITHS